MNKQSWVEKERSINLVLCGWPAVDDFVTMVNAAVSSCTTTTGLSHIHSSITFLGKDKNISVENYNIEV